MEAIDWKGKADDHMGWKDGSTVRSTPLLQRTRGQFPATRQVAHNCV